MSFANFRDLLKKPVFMIAILVLPVLVIVPTLQAQTSAVTLSIPSLNIQASVVEIYIKAFPDGAVTWDTRALGWNIGHLEQMPWFGDGGNIVLGGHSEDGNRQPSVFAGLQNARIGELVTVDVDGTQYQYAVSEVRRVSEDDLSILYPSTGERLTLFTCDTSSYNAVNDRYPHRIVVIAERVG